MSYVLDDIDEANHGEPEDPEDVLERSTLEPGMFAKLVFRGVDDVGEATAEKMWVHVESVETVLPDRGIRYGGRLDNHPAMFRGVEWADPVTFEPRHIVDMVREPADWEPHRRDYEERGGQLS